MVFRSCENVPVPKVDLLSWIFGDQQYDKNKDIYIDALSPSRRLTANRAESHVRKLITGLRENGIKEGDSVVVQSFGDIMYPIVFLAIIGVGAIFVGANPGSTAHELTNLITQTSARYIFTVPSRLSIALESVQAPNVSIPRSKVFVLDSPHDTTSCDGFQTVSNLCAQHEEATEIIGLGAATAQGNKIAALFATSGTTGLPKTAAVSHRASIARCIASWDPQPKTYTMSRLICLPMFHGVAATASFIDPLRFGIPTYIQPRFEFHAFVQAINDHHITETTMVPAVMRTLLQEHPTMSQDALRKYLKSLKLVRCAGAPLDVALQRKFSGLLDDEARIVSAWGLTEAGTVTSFFGTERDDTGSVGRLTANIEARIIDSEGEDMERDNTSGDILVRGPSTMTGYHENPSANQDAFADGWLRTGDIGYCREGKWYIVGRSKDMIKVRGWQVAPAEIEACIMQHPMVLEVSVIGVKFASNEGEFPRAYIVLKNGAEITSVTKELHAMVEVKLAKYKALDGGIKSVSSLPKTASGKVMKAVLREEAAKELSENLCTI